MLSWCQSGIAELPRKVFRFSRIMSESFPLKQMFVRSRGVEPNGSQKRLVCRSSLARV